MSPLCPGVGGVVSPAKSATILSDIEILKILPRSGRSGPGFGGAGGSDRIEVLAVYGQITLHINALGLGCITLLGHACWALVQLLLLAAPRICGGRRDGRQGKFNSSICLPGYLYFDFSPVCLQGIYRYCKHVFSLGLRQTEAFEGAPFGVLKGKPKKPPKSIVGVRGPGHVTAPKSTHPMEEGTPNLAWLGLETCHGWSSCDRIALEPTFRK